MRPFVFHSSENVDLKLAARQQQLPSVTEGHPNAACSFPSCADRKDKLSGIGRDLMLRCRFESQTVTWSLTGVGGVDAAISCPKPGCNQASKWEAKVLLVHRAFGPSSGSF